MICLAILDASKSNSKHCSKWASVSASKSLNIDVSRVQTLFLAKSGSISTILSGSLGLHNTLGR